MWQAKVTKTCVQRAAQLGTFQRAPKQWWQSIKRMPDSLETSFRNDALPSFRRWRSQVREVFRLSELILPWKLWWHKFFFIHRTPSFLPSFPSYLLPSAVSPPPLSFPPPLSVFLFFFLQRNIEVIATVIPSQDRCQPVARLQIQRYKKVGLICLRWKK